MIVSKAGSPVVPALDPIRWLREALPMLTFCQLLRVVGPMVLPTELGAPLPPVINHAGTRGLEIHYASWTSQALCLFCFKLCHFTVNLLKLKKMLVMCQAFVNILL